MTSLALILTTATPGVWNIIFNITVPGWLPASSVVGIEEVGVRYGLYATAKLVDLDEHKNGSWGFATLCAPFRSKFKSAFGQKPVELRRFAAPPSLGLLSLGTVNFQVKNLSISSLGVEEGKKRIPPELLDKIQVVLSVPEVVDVDQEKMGVTLRLRSNGLKMEDRRRIRLLDVNLSLRQHEKCRYVDRNLILFIPNDKHRSRPSRAYQNRYPLPPTEEQPPNCPLLDPSSIASVYDAGMLPISDRCESNSRSFALMPSHQSGHFTFDESNNLLFANDPAHEQSGDQSSWYNLEIKLPFTKQAIVDDDWDITADLRPTTSTPLFMVHHELTATIAFSYEFPDSDEVTQEKLSFVVSPSFGHVAPPPPRPLSPSSSPDSNAQNCNVPSLPVVEPYAPMLPVYSQLYDVNGNVRIDYSVPLPLYTPPENATNYASSSPTTVAEVMDIPIDNLSWKDIATRQSSIDGNESDEETAPLLGAPSP
jgi:hypothetical protein